MKWPKPIPGFDALALKRKIQSKIAADIRGMTHAEELAYYRGVAPVHARGKPNHRAVASHDHDARRGAHQRRARPHSQRRSSRRPVEAK